VSDPAQSEEAQGTDAALGAEVVDALPVLAQEPTIVPVRTAPGAVGRSAGVMIPAVQAAAVAAGGFVAGAAVVGLVQRRHRQSTPVAKGRRARGLGRAGRSIPSGAELVQIVSSRSLLVDVHLLGPAGGDR
jgi:hypothetical protein